ncbi:hypothetical protein JHK85_054343 [Glycine max]|nr:hypothetical protein JHK85_054343 [Glycine max]
MDLTANLNSSFHFACVATKTSRWDPSYGRMSGSDYFNSMHYGAGDDSAAESEYVSGFCIERKIDLTSHIKWWGSNKSRHSDVGTRLSEEKKLGSAGDICIEIKQLEQKVQPTAPYQMPQLGRPQNEKKHRSSSVSALSILSQSAAYKSLQEKASKTLENIIDNDENENKNTINKLDHGKAVEKPSNHDGGNDRLDIATGMSGTMSLQRNVYPLTPFLSAPLLTAYNTVDPLVDPVLWTSLVPMLPAGLSHTAEVGYKDRDQLNVHDVSARGMNGWTFGFPIEEERLKGKHLKAELVPNKEQNIGLKCSTSENTTKQRGEGGGSKALVHEEEAGINGVSGVLLWARKQSQI